MTSEEMTPEEMPPQEMPPQEMAHQAAAPQELAPNLINHYYRGGSAIARLRGIQTSSEFQPEEWLAATVSKADADDATIGMSRTIHGDLLRDLVEQNPLAWVGPGHNDRAEGADVGILFKLLDAGQRLPVHVHPNRDFARSHLGCPYGKTEAWFVLAAEPGSAVYVGWKSAVAPDELERRRDAQDSEWMLAHLNRIEVQPGMGILVPAGTAHAIDAGVFVAEVQEPSDFSILLEWSITTSSRDESHLGLGFDTAMEAVSTDELSPPELDALIVRSNLSQRHSHEQSVLVYAADPFFRLHRISPPPGQPVAIDAGFAVLLAVEGMVTVQGSDVAVNVSGGQVFAVPHAFGPWHIEGDGTALVGRPGDGWPGSLQPATSESPATSVPAEGGRDFDA